MGRKLLWLGLVGGVAVIAALLWTQRYGACAHAVAYRVGTVDERFGLRPDEVREALRRAEGLWERALGRTLFANTPTAALTVEFVFDERQQRTQSGDRLRTSMHATRTSHASAGQTYEQWRRTYEGRVRDLESAQAAYLERAQAFNTRVQEWNARGGAPRDVQAELEAERARLDATRREIESDRAALGELATTVNAWPRRAMPSPRRTTRAWPPSTGYTESRASSTRASTTGAPSPSSSSMTSATSPSCSPTSWGMPWAWVTSRTPPPS